MLLLYIAAAVLAVIGITLVFAAVKQGTLRSEMAATHTTSIDQAQAGRQVELKGVARAQEPLEAPHAKTPCVHYSYRLRQRERSHTSNSGRARYRWRTIDSGSNAIRFGLFDDSGAITVLPDDASFRAQKLVDQYVRPGQSEAFEEMGGGALKTVVGAAMALGLGRQQKLEVFAVPVDQPLYVLGTVQQDHQGNLAVGKGDGEFLISTKSEEQLRRELGRKLIIYYVIAGVCFAAAVGILIYALTA